MKMVYSVLDRTVRDPVTGREVTTAGVNVDENDSFWLRRLNDGDVTDVKPEETENQSSVSTADETDAGGA
jgi:hypothetical protein